MCKKNILPPVFPELCRRVGGKIKRTISKRFFLVNLIDLAAQKLVLICSILFPVDPSTSFDTFLLTQKHSGRAEKDAFTAELSRSIREDGKASFSRCIGIFFFLLLFSPLNASIGSNTAVSR